MGQALRVHRAAERKRVRGRQPGARNGGCGAGCCWRRSGRCRGGLRRGRAGRLWGSVGSWRLIAFFRAGDDWRDEQQQARGRPSGDISPSSRISRFLRRAHSSTDRAYYNSKSAGPKRMLSSSTRLMVTRAERADVIDEQVVARLGADLRAALRRRPAQEARLAGVLRAVAPHSAPLCERLLDAFELMVKRASFDRPLYAASVRAIGESADRRATPSFKKALESEESGGFATLSAACRTTDPGLADALANVARSRHAHVAFAGEVARIARGESGGEHVTLLAPKIKESHRIALCLELFVPLIWSKPLSPAIAPALAVLREAERHLGRWLVLGEVATRAGDGGPLADASLRANEGPLSSRAAWAMVVWALSLASPPPAIRPTVELVARLSDRPSADRDTTFLFRLARQKAPAARAMLETLAKGPLNDESGVRAALHLVRDYGDPRPLELLRVAANSVRREALRGLAVAALFDVGDREWAVDCAKSLVSSRHLSSVAWGALIQAAHAKNAPEVTSEPSVRRIQFGWSE